MNRKHLGKITMQVGKQILNLIVWPALASLLAGCSGPGQNVQVASKPQPTAAPLVQTEISNRFQDPPAAGPTAVESAIELSQKYAELADKTTALQRENQTLIAENQRLRNELIPCQAKLAQAQKELAEANDLLIEMRIELNNWKADVLGFRNEVRESDKAQIEALLKILKVLGGELPAESPQGNDVGATAAPTDKPRPLE